VSVWLRQRTKYKGARLALDSELLSELNRPFSHHAIAAAATPHVRHAISPLAHAQTPDANKLLDVPNISKLDRRVCFMFRRSFCDVNSLRSKGKSDLLPDLINKRTNAKTGGLVGGGSPPTRGTPTTPFVIRTYLLQYQNQAAKCTI
jgi:hypothetical protein